jgi:hypothetical protein
MEQHLEPRVRFYVTATHYLDLGPVEDVRRSLAAMARMGLGEQFPTLKAPIDPLSQADLARLREHATAVRRRYGLRLALPERTLLYALEPGPSQRLVPDPERLPRRAPRDRDREPVTFGYWMDGEVWVEQCPRVATGEHALRYAPDDGVEWVWFRTCSPRGRAGMNGGSAIPTSRAPCTSGTWSGRSRGTDLAIVRRTGAGARPPCASGRRHAAQTPGLWRGHAATRPLRNGPLEECSARARAVTPPGTGRRARRRALRRAVRLAV